jgi:hypothetical protein
VGRGALNHDAGRDRREHPADRVRLGIERPHEPPFDQRAQRGRQHQGERSADQEWHPALNEHDCHDRAKHVDVAVREIGGLRGFPHDVEAERDQRIDTTECQPVEQVLESFTHRASQREAAIVRGHQACACARKAPLT